MYGILRKREGYTQYFVLNFSNTVQEGDVVRFTAADQNLDIPLKKTYETKEIDIRSLSDDLRKYETMEYSALGVKVTGEELKNSYQPSEELYFKFKVRYKSGEEERLELDGALQQKGGNTEFGAVYQFRKEFDWSEVEAVSVNDIWFEL